MQSKATPQQLSSKSITSCVTFDPPAQEDCGCWDEMSVYPALSPDDDFFKFKPKPISKMVDRAPARKNNENRKRLESTKKSSSPKHLWTRSNASLCVINIKIETVNIIYLSLRQMFKLNRYYYILYWLLKVSYNFCNIFHAYLYMK